MITIWAHITDFKQLYGTIQPFAITTICCLSRNLLLDPTKYQNTNVYDTGMYMKTRVRSTEGIITRFSTHKKQCFFNSIPRVMCLFEPSIPSPCAKRAYQVAHQNARRFECF